MLEAAIWACPVISGPHLFNFQDISNMLIEAEAMVVRDNAEAISQTLDHWLQQPSVRHRMGDNGLKIVMANRGALDHLLNIAETLLIKPMD
jgi:3-deoxy-D-manno-octulosonic-acid transferase